MVLQEENEALADGSGATQDAWEGLVIVGDEVLVLGVEGGWKYES